MSRAAILPTPGDPFLIHYWLMGFPNWSHVIDRLYIYVNSPAEYEVIDYIRWLCNEDPKINFQYTPTQTEHGECINRVLDIVKEDYVMLVEDDCFIWKPQQIEESFIALEKGLYDIVGSKRGSCGMEILQQAQLLHGISYEGEGDQGPNFWPNLFFSSAELLRSTDRNFGARLWRAGEEIEWLNFYRCKTDQAGDTFVNTSLQLRTMVDKSRIAYLPQYHGHPDDNDHYLTQRYLFDGNAPWCHIGSLSSGFNGVLVDAKGRPLGQRKIAMENPLALVINAPTTDMEKREWERRAQWWLTFYEHADTNEIPEILQEYGDAINRLIDAFGLSRGNIKTRQKIYKSIGLW